MKINPYLAFDGQCEAAFRFYEKCLGGKIVAMVPHAGTPGESMVPAEHANKIMHARLIVSGDQALMGSDTPMQKFQGSHGFSVNIGFDTAEEAERVFAALSEGGTVHMPIAETFWAVRFGMFVDQFGIPWMINCEKPMP